MKRISKRIFLILMVAVMIGCMITGCGNGQGETKTDDNSSEGSRAEEVSRDMENENQTGDVKTVSIHLTGGGDYSDAQSVEDAMNAISIPEYGIKFDLNYIEYGNYAQQCSLLLTGDEADIIMVYITPFTTFVKNGQLYDITELYANASEDFKAYIAQVDPGFGEMTKATTVNGRLYALPRVGTNGANTCLAVAEPYAAEFGIKGGETWTLDEVDAFLAKVHEKYPDKYAIVPQGPGLMTNGMWTWDGLGDDSMVGIVDAFGQDTTVHNLYENEEFLRLCRYTRSWYENKYMMQDCLSNTEASMTLFTGTGVCCFNVGTNHEFGGGNDLLKSIFLTDDKLITSNASVICYGINANTKDAQSAWKAMELIYTHPQIGKLFANGIEGVHYRVDEKGNAVYPDGKDSSNVGYNGVYESWDYPNGLIGESTWGDGRSAEVLKEYKENTVKISQAFGFCFDSEPVVDEYTACVNVMSKYTQPLLMGAVDPEETIAQAIKELEAAGIDAVIAEKQRQFDEWLKNQ